MGAHLPEAVMLYTDQVGDWQHREAYMQPVHEHDPRSIDERMEPVIVWTHARRAADLQTVPATPSN